MPPTRERKGPNPKPEIRGPKEGRNPKSEMSERGFGLRYAAFFLVSALGIRIWAACGGGGGWYCPDTPPGRFPRRLLVTIDSVAASSRSVPAGWPPLSRKGAPVYRVG